MEVVKLLIDAGAEVNAKTKDGRTPLDYARVLRETTSKFNPLTARMRKKQDACAKLLREHGAR